MITKLFEKFDRLIDLHKELRLLRKEFEDAVAKIVDKTKQLYTVVNSHAVIIEELYNTQMIIVEKLKSASINVDSVNRNKDNAAKPN